MAIEMDVEFPEREDSIFSRYPLVLKQPYLDFARDMLRLMLGGMFESKDLDLYSRGAIDGMTRRRWFRKADRSILEMIAVTLRMAAYGNGPRVACEFGRQAIPAVKKPIFGGWKNCLRSRMGFYVRREAWRGILTRKLRDLSKACCLEFLGNAGLTPIFISYNHGDIVMARFLPRSNKRQDDRKLPEPPLDTKQ